MIMMNNNSVHSCNRDCLMASLLKLACYLEQPLNFAKELTRSSIYADQTKTSKTRILKGSAGKF